MNKAKQKRRLRKAIKRRPREIHQVQETKTAAAWRNIFVEAGILIDEQH